MSGKRRKGREPARKAPPPAPPTPSSSPLTAPSVVIAPQLSRRQARIERRRQRNRRVGLAGGAAIVAAAVVLVALGVFVGPKVVHHYSHNKKPTQTTVLMQIQGSSGSAQASVLLAQGPASNQGVEVLIPARVITDVCGYGTEDFGDVLGLPGGVAASQQALSSMLGNATIDGSWVLTSAELAKLVDAVGGITADVDVNVVQRESGGRSKVLVPAGNSEKLSGAQAAEYATYTANRSEDASAQQARLQQVVDGILTALPSSQTAIAARLRGLGSAAGSTLGVNRLASVLAGLAAANRSTSGLFPTDLPVSPIDSGGAPSYQVDNTSATGVRALVRTHLSESVPAGGSARQPTVLLLNGVGSPGLVRTACPRLTAHGLAYAGSNNTATFSNTKPSVVEIRSDSSSDIALGDRVARALGLPTGDVQRDPGDERVADVIVTLGSDYKP